MDSLPYTHLHVAFAHVRADVPLCRSRSLSFDKQPCQFAKFEPGTDNISHLREGRCSSKSHSKRSWRVEAEDERLSCRSLADGASRNYERPASNEINEPASSSNAEWTTSKLQSADDVLSCQGSNLQQHFRLSSVLPFLPTFLAEAWTSSPSLQSSLIVTSSIFALGMPLLLSGLTLPGLAAAFCLGTITWWAFGGAGFAIVALYFVLGTAVTKLRLSQKEKEGIAEKRKGRRGIGSVLGSGTAGIVSAAATIVGRAAGMDAAVGLCQLAFVASFCTKLSDTTSSEVGKSYGKTTYLITNFQIVPRGTEGAVSLEGTLAGLAAAAALAAVAFLSGQVSLEEAAFCVLASQVANYLESLIGATLQDTEGYAWLTNDVVNVLNITAGAMIAVVLRVVLQ